MSSERAAMRVPPFLGPEATGTAVGLGGTAVAAAGGAAVGAAPHAASSRAAAALISAALRIDRGRAVMGTPFVMRSPSRGRAKNIQ